MLSKMYSLNDSYYDIYINGIFITIHMKKENQSIHDLLYNTPKSSPKNKTKKTKSEKTIENEFFDKNDEKFNLIIKKKQTQKSTLNCIKIDIKPKKELPKRLEISLIDDQYDKSKSQSFIFSDIVEIELNNNIFKEFIYEKMAKYFKNTRVDVPEIDMEVDKVTNKKLFEINKGDISYFKVNNFDEPCKRVTHSGFNISTFELGNNIYKMIVKTVSRYFLCNGIGESIA